MLRKILIIAIIFVLVVAFGCKKKTEKPVAPPKAEPNVQKQPEESITKENMNQQLDKIEKEIKNDVAGTEPNV
jgi:hypothetical protein